METFLNLLMILGSLSQLHSLQILDILLQHKAQISCNRQILASFASRINKNRLKLKKKHNQSGLITRTNKRMVGKMGLYLQKQQTKMRNPIAVECQVAIFLYYISKTTKDVIENTQVLLLYLEVQSRF